jgi:hypothetical protein
MRIPKRLGVPALLLLLCASALCPRAGAQASTSNRQEEARLRLAQAESLYSGGDYERCGRLLDGYIEEHRSRAFRLLGRERGRVYGLRALVAYALRGEGEGYKEEVRLYLWSALEANPELELGAPAEVPVFVLDLFYKLKQEYLAQFSRSTKRWSLGLLGAVVIDPTVVQDPSLLQPGLYACYNLSEAWSLLGDLRLPMSAPVWGSIRGQAGVAWFPYYNIRKINPCFILTYQFALDNLETYTHSLSLGGQSELVSRKGLGFGMRVEFLRLDLILGQNVGDVPAYRSIALFGTDFLRASFANTNFLIFYRFGKRRPK